MRKRIFAFLLGFFCCPLLVAARTPMTNYYGYYYSGWSQTLSGLSFENIQNATYAVFLYDGKISLNDVGFQYNKARGIYVAQYGTIQNMTLVDFVQNSGGGAYFTQTSQPMNTVSFKSNHTTSYGGGFFSTNDLTVSGKDILFSSNSASKGGAIYASKNLTLTGKNIRFIGNSADQGGGIYALKDVTLRADGGDILFSGNSNHAVYLENNASYLSLQTLNNGRILFYDTVGTDGQIKIRISGDSGGVYFYKALPNASISLQEGGLYLDPDENWHNTSLSVSEGRLLSTDGAVRHLSLGNVVLSGTLHVVPDVDFQGGTMDTFSAYQISGSGAIQVDGFHFLNSPTQENATFTFMTGAGKNRVSVPEKVYFSVYAYEVSYNPFSGTISFLPISVTTVDGFNPAALIQPIKGYASLKLLSDSLRPLRARADNRYFVYEDAPSSFYITPYKWGGKTSFSELEVNESVTGVQTGWDSADLGLFEDAAVTGGFNIGMSHNAQDYESTAFDTTLYQAGGNLRLYAGNFFGEVTAQVGFISNRLKTYRANMRTLTAVAAAEIGYNIDIGSQEWFLRPSVGYSYGWLPEGNEMFLESQALTSSPMTLSQLRAGSTLSTVRDGKWQGYLGIWCVSPSFSAGELRAGAEKVPDLPFKPYAEFSLGVQMHTASRLAWGIELMGSGGSTHAFGGNLTVQF